jgi:hypothetical protein
MSGHFESNAVSEVMSFNSPASRFPGVFSIRVVKLKTKYRSLFLHLRDSGLIWARFFCLDLGSVTLFLLGFATGR